MKRLVIPVIVFLAFAWGIGYLTQTSRTGVVGGGGGGASPVAGGIPALAGGGGAVIEQEGDIAVTVPQSESLAEGGSGIASIGNLPAIGPQIVKTAQLSVVVKKDTFEDAFQRATLVARRYGGFVESSSTAGTKSQSGTLLIRVPNASFESALRDLAGLGEVDGQSISGQDVTSQFVDLQARLRTWEAQESVLLDLMRQATSIEGTLRVQRELQDVQLRIEQIKGQLRVLENQTELSTIDVSMREAGVPIRIQQAPASNRPSLGEAWDRALNGFLGVVYTVVIGLGYLLPITALALVSWAAYRRLRQPVPTRSA